MFAAIGYVATAWLAADLIAGFWHWIEDRYFDVKWPLIGEYIAKPNELHHEQPTAFLYGGYWHRNWTAIVPAIIAAVVCGVLGGYWLALVFAMASQANEIHAWAHSKGKLSPLVVALQETGVLQSPGHHARHHRDPFEVRYCVMTDWLNPLLDHFRFWRRLEWIVSRIGVHPK